MNAAKKQRSIQILIVVRIKDKNLILFVFKHAKDLIQRREKVMLMKDIDYSKKKISLPSKPNKTMLI